MIGAKCRTCGLMQMPRPTCKSCGTALERTGPRPTPAQSSAHRPIPPPPPRAGPIYRTQEPPPLTQDLPPPIQEAPLHPGASAGRIHRLSFHGTGGSLFGIQIVNTFLTFISVGIYYFWGKTRVRSYLLGQTDFAGDRFAYHGTGKELLVGFLKAALLFGVPLGGLIIAPDLVRASDVVKEAATFVASGIILVVVPLAMVGARRYRLSRTSWRGIRFSFRGSAKEFIKLFVGGSILTALTLGLYYAIFMTRKHDFMVSHSYFGNQRFHFHGRGRDLFGSFLLALVLYPPTLGLYWFWFQAKKQRFFWDHTTFAGARFRSTVTGGRLFLLKLGNLLLLVVTLGLAWPWVVVRNARFAFRYLTLEGPLDLAAIEQEAQVASATGEGLASFLDMDAGFDFG